MWLHDLLLTRDLIFDALGRSPRAWQLLPNGRLGYAALFTLSSRVSSVNQPTHCHSGASIASAPLAAATRLPGLSGVEDCISVGFLKLDEHVLEKIQRYAEAYDVVIIGDGDMSYANEILHEVVG